MSTSTDAQGVAAAAGTAICWAMTAVFFSAASRRIGQLHVNKIRLLLALVLLAAACAVFGAYQAVPAPQLVLLSLSGVVGLALGDAALFSALRIIGPRRGSLIMSLSPGFAAVLMLPLLDETLSWAGVVGMLLTVGGIAWVVLERGQPGEIEGNAAVGVALGVLGAVGQSVGLILAKAGLGAASASSRLGAFAAAGGSAPPVHPLLGTLVRMLAATVLLFGYGLVTGSLRDTFRALADRRALRMTAAGAVFGPVIGVTLSLTAISLTNTAVAATIMATSPVIVIPLVWIIYRHRVSPRAILGALVAIAGVAVLTYREPIARWLS